MPATLIYAPKKGESSKFFVPIENSHDLPSGQSLSGRQMMLIEGRHEVSSAHGEAILESAERYPAIAHLFDTEQLVVTIEDRDIDTPFGELSDSERGLRISKSQNLEELSLWSQTKDLKPWRKSQITRKMRNLS